MLSGSSPMFSLSNHTIFSQTQTGATVPFIICSLGHGWRDIGGKADVRINIPILNNIYRGCRLPCSWA